MLGKLLSSFDSVKIDTKLDNPTLSGGQTLTGQVVFQGANTTKKINGLSLALCTRAEVEAADNEYSQDLVIAQWQLSGAFELAAKQAVNIPFDVMLPLETPLTQLQCHYNKTEVWLHTQLDVDWGLDARDNDYLTIVPNAAMQAFLTAMEQCGFGLYSADVEKGQLRGGNFYSTIGCYQELEFRPMQIFNRINEVEVSFVAHPDQTHVLLEVDRKFGGYDQYLTLSIPHHGMTIESLVVQIRRLLNLP